jgi:hypothetical protein
VPPKVKGNLLHSRAQWQVGGYLKRGGPPSFFPPTYDCKCHLGFFPIPQRSDSGEKSPDIFHKGRKDVFDLDR